MHLGERFFHHFSRATVRCQETFVFHLRSRRNRLRDLALIHLSTEEIDRLGISRTAVLDVQTSTVIHALKSCGVEIGSELATCPDLSPSRFMYGDVYEYFGLTGVEAISAVCQGGYVQMLTHATFDALGLRHTCSDKGLVEIEEEDREEVWDEDSDMLIELEELVVEHQEALGRSTCSLPVFLRTQWKDRMEQFLDELQEQSKLARNERGAMTEMGISLESSESPGSEYQDWKFSDLEAHDRRLAYPIDDDSDATDTSVRDCITVAVLPEDLAAACTDACRPERCDEATVRPHEEPGVDRGVPGSFVPFQVPEREAEIRALPPEPLALFLRYVPYEVVDRWAEWTNTAAATAQHGPLRRRSRIKAWRPTTAHEIYLFLGILICMGLHSESQVFRYWSTSQDQEDPIYLFTRFMARDRFQLLLRRIRIFNPADFPDTPTPSEQRRRGQAREGLMPKVYRQVNGWSAHIQETGESFYAPGTGLTVDEAMVRFTGRSTETTTVPNKPTPVGFKV
ncbi:hypothetical protein CMUS01_15901 [Colletotrichum musicola]|uniref:PiggyBac transposable element-derived protein domain-containing protein n=1 Tax=Colletotrichum musicola TaxID=2175873 RepID=A0A8H6MKG8_9PEZI|nr:hypothetical protein CMUS01_15901 [Colletotrichum musicola]